jgi:hypothetical protein
MFSFAVVQFRSKRGNLRIPYVYIESYICPLDEHNLLSPSCSYHENLDLNILFPRAATSGVNGDEHLVKLTQHPD